MVRVVELKEMVLNSNVYENIYNIKDISEQIIEELQLLQDINKDDYNYIELILEKTKINLQKAYMLLKLSTQCSV